MKNKNFMILITGTDLLVNLLTSLWTAEGKVQAGATSLGVKLRVFFLTEDNRKYWIQDKN